MAISSQESNTNKSEAPYGSWTSPITAEMTTLTEKSNRSCDIAFHRKKIFWTEPRPFEKGRTVIMQQSEDGLIQTITPEGFDVRSKVHEYGGRAFAIVDSHIYFVHAKDQRLYKQAWGKDPQPLTEEGIRFADFLPIQNGLIAIAETHKQGKVENFLALINTSTGSFHSLDQGQNFYASPTLSPDGRKLAWLTWNHPNMPWDGCLLWTADFVNGTLENKRMIAGGTDESIFQPQWSPKGHLFFISDKEGWWNFYRFEEQQSENVCPMQAEFGLPMWRLGTSTWGFTGRDEEILCSYQENGTGKIALLDPDNKKLKSLLLGFDDYSQITLGESIALFLAGSAQTPRKIAKLDLNTLSLTFVEKEETPLIDAAYISLPVSVEFPSTPRRSSYGYFYEPLNKQYKGLKESLPPLIIMSHGGPTAACDSIFNLRIQYWTSRGFAVLNVNYGGSTGYGRKYRESLKGNWGIIDVEDCIQGGIYLAQQKKVDSNKIVIRGSSAGGYTTLEALARGKIFAAGASYYGVSDLELLIQDTHKFEAHYLDSLIGPYPDRKDLYFERSPLNHADKISCPVIFFQGGKDKVVPPNQTQSMYEALKKRGIHTELIYYENEEHGFRQAEAIKDSLEKELQFYLDVFK